MTDRVGVGTVIPRGPRGRIPASIAARLTYDKLTHRYGDLEAIKDFSLDVAPGEIVCLLGPSGCGKTTLLRLAAGVEERHRRDRGLFRAFLERIASLVGDR